MPKVNLFVRLEGYGRENFTTETLAYILETDQRVTKEFLNLLLGRDAVGKRRLAAFRDYVIDTQIAYVTPKSKAIIDLQITSRKDDSQRICIEVKTRSPEREGQIRKYLELECYVAYLTPLGFPSPSDHDDDENYLGHFTWDKVYSIIGSAKPDNITHRVIYKQFLEYLEARHMGPSKPITRDELRAATHAVALIRKSEALVSSVRDKIEPHWIDRFGENDDSAKGVCDGLADEDLPYWWYRTKGWHKKRRFYLCIGISKGGRRHRPGFYLQIGSGQKPSWRRLDPLLKKRFDKLCERGWVKEDADSDEWGYRNFFRCMRERLRRSHLAKQRTYDWRRSSLKNFRSLS
jgi:hypothetical protein